MFDIMFFFSGGTHSMLLFPCRLSLNELHELTRTRHRESIRVECDEFVIRCNTVIELSLTWTLAFAAFATLTFSACIFCLRRFLHDRTSRSKSMAIVVNGGNEIKWNRERKYKSWTRQKKQAKISFAVYDTNVILEVNEFSMNEFTTEVGHYHYIHGRGGLLELPLPAGTLLIVLND